MSKTSCETSIWIGFVPKRCSQWPLIESLVMTPYVQVQLLKSGNKV